MNVNLNVNNSNPSFGYLHALPDAKKLLQETYKSRNKRIQLHKIIASQKSNPIHITLDKYSDKRLCATCGYRPADDAREYYREEYIQKAWFESPLKFIKRVCARVDTINQELKGNIWSVSGKENELHQRDFPIPLTAKEKKEMIRQGTSYFVIYPNSHKGVLRTLLDKFS